VRREGGGQLCAGAEEEAEALARRTKRQWHWRGEGDSGQDREWRRGKGMPGYIGGTFSPGSSQDLGLNGL
jgi:hypothetical protein